METILEKPTPGEQKTASELVLNFATALAKGKSDTVNIQIQEIEESFVVPRRALEFLSQILSGMAEGKAIYLLPADSELSTQQAAEILGMSRPHVVKLLEKGIIPFKKVGSHRRISLDDLTRYESELKEERTKSFSFMTKQAQELNLGY